MSEIFKSSYRNIFILSLLVFLITAFFSTGCFHPDEHFQILEFCNFKLGQTPAADLPWEFHERIRPALQPALGYLIIKGLNIISIQNPFTYSLIFRILAAIFSWLVISKFCLLLIKEFSTEKARKIFIWMSLFLWFVPLLSVRFSSENYSALTLFSAVYLIIKFNDSPLYKNILQLIFAGMLLGFSFYFRFQMGLAILGIGLWLVIIGKMKWKNLSVLIVSGMLAITFCIYLDYWFYGSFELSPVNYFLANIIENKAADYGTDPWWYYFILFILKAVPPISIILLGFFLIGIYKKPRSIFVWILIPFLIGHFAIGHKELRFLFPMVFILIYLANIGIESYFAKQKLQRIGRYIFIFAAAINFIILASIMFTPAQDSINCYKFLYNNSSKNEMILLCKEKNVYDMVGIKTHFYESSKVKCVVLKDNVQISNYLKINKQRQIYLLERNFSSNNDFVGYHSKIVYSTFPKWISNFNFNNWMSRASVWKIVEIQKID